MPDPSPAEEQSQPAGDEEASPHGRDRAEDPPAGPKDEGIDGSGKQARSTRHECATNRAVGAMANHQERDRVKKLCITGECHSWWPYLVLDRCLPSSAPGRLDPKPPQCMCSKCPMQSAFSSDSLLTVPKDNSRCPQDGADCPIDIMVTVRHALISRPRSRPPHLLVLEMFSLATLKENIKLSPSKLRHDYIQAIVLALNQKYCNRVVINVGLCVSVFDVMEAGDPYVHPGEASAYVKGTCTRLLMRMPGLTLPSV